MEHLNETKKASYDNRRCETVYFTSKSNSLNHLEENRKMFGDLGILDALPFERLIVHITHANSSTSQQQLSGMLKPV